MTRQLTLPVTPCCHLEALVQALKPLMVDLNDAYSDWFVCVECHEGIRLDDRGSIVECQGSDGVHWKWYEDFINPPKWVKDDNRWIWDDYREC